METSLLSNLVDMVLLYSDLYDSFLGLFFCILININPHSRKTETLFVIARSLGVQSNGPLTFTVQGSYYKRQTMPCNIILYCVLQE